MAMQFTPNNAFLRGMDLGSPASSQGALNNLLQLQQNSLNGMVNTIGDMQKTNRTSNVNDMIAQGGLTGLNEEQARQKLLGTAGGQLTDAGQKSVDELMNGIGRADQRNFQTGERVAGQNFTTGRDKVQNDFINDQRMLGEAFTDTQSTKSQTFKSGENEKDRKVQLQIAKDNVNVKREEMKADKDYKNRLLNIETQKELNRRNEIKFGKDKADNISKGLMANLKDPESQKFISAFNGNDQSMLDALSRTGELSIQPNVDYDDKGKPFRNGTKILFNGRPINNASNGGIKEIYNKTFNPTPKDKALQNFKNLTQIGVL